MEYVYCAMLLHASKKEINEENVKKVLEAAGVKSDEGRIKALVSSLEGVNIEEAIKEATSQMVAVPVASEIAHSAKKEEKKEEKKDDSAAAAGLGALFG